MDTVAIIGGGAAGMMAAATCIESGAPLNIIVIEKNPILGRKVIISGGGRCNVTTGINDVRTLLNKYYRGNPFLTKALYHFPPSAVYEWFEEHGVGLKTEKDNRVFPQSDNGHDIVGVFEKLFEKKHVTLKLKTAVTHIEKNDKQFVIQTADGERLVADKLIITTGGQAYRKTGSTGDGYAFAQSLGHSITPLAASLNSFVLAEKWPKEHSGVSFEWVELRSQKYRAQGPIVLTHTGVSGPAVFALSSQVAFEQYTKEHPLTITIDFVPHIDQETLVQIMTKKIEAHPKEYYTRLLQTWVPHSIATVCATEIGVAPDAPAATTNKQQRLESVAWLKKSQVHAIGRTAGSEFVTAGGVDTTEIHPATMESRITPGLYFAGEIMNVDGITGGFNLQASWATGRLAGISAVG